jgi:hypothetical protein
MKQVLVGKEKYLQLPRLHHQRLPWLLGDHFLHLHQLPI